MTSTWLVCAACGTELPSDSKFCNKCCTPVGLQHSPAEYKQVTVLFAELPIRLGYICGCGAGSPPDPLSPWVIRGTRRHRYQSSASSALVVLGDLPCHPRHRRIVVLDAHQVRLGTGANAFDGLGERDHVDDELGGLAE